VNVLPMNDDMLVVADSCKSRKYFLVQIIVNLGNIP
jgi:hypothetical protein